MYIGLQDPVLQLDSAPSLEIIFVFLSFLNIVTWERSVTFYTEMLSLKIRFTSIRNIGA